MKKIFSHPFILSLLIIAALIFFNNQGWLNSFKNIFYSVITPGEEFSYRVSFQVNKFLGFIVSVNDLEDQNVQLKEENQKLLGELNQLNEVVRENKLLREQINVIEPQPRDLILANIIGQDSSGLRRYFLINKGSKDGVKEKSVVVAAGNLLVGQVTEVNESFSKVQSIIDPNSRVNALISESSVTGLVRGEQGNGLIIDLLPQSEVIKQNQSVITSGLAGFFPNGLLIGQIEQVISLDVQISQMAKIKAAVNFKSLEKVFVIK